MSRQISDNFGFYAVLTNPVIGYDRMTSLLVDANAAFVQLRMKDEPRDKIIKTALSMRKITANTNTRFIVNDDPHIALEVGADGVHVGQGDMSYNDVRALVGDDMIIGVSTHNVDQTRAACELRPDYIGVGPVYPTPTKKIADPAIGIDGMRKMLAVANAANIPAVCIGGITLSNLKEVRDNGAKNFCMVRELMLCDDPESVIKNILAALG